MAVFGFVPNSRPGQDTAYYLDLTATHKTKIYEVQGTGLYLKYNDEIGKSKYIDITLRNWKNEEVSKLTLSKSFGLNYYRIPFSYLNGKLEDRQLYELTASDENGKLHGLKFVPSLNKDEETPEVELVLNPVSDVCNEVPGQTIVEVYGKIKGGKAPYDIQWDVYAGSKQGLLYKPQKEQLKDQHEASRIMIDKAPDYFIQLKVKDACGAEELQTVHVLCEEKGRRVHTLFIEPENIRSNPSRGK